MKTEERLISIFNSKKGVKTSIINKGVKKVGDTFSDFPSYIDRIRGGGDINYDNEYTPDGSWWDIESIIKNPIYHLDGYPIRVILLVDDTYDSINLKGVTNTSDGYFYTSDSLHVWNKEMDKPVDGNVYKTRWVMYHFKGDNINLGYTEGSASSSYTTSTLSIISNAKIINGLCMRDLNKLRNIKFINGVPMLKQTDLSNSFRDCALLSNVGLFNTVNVTNMSGMFRGCTRLLNIPLFDTSNVTNMSYMFENCKYLQGISSIDTSNVTNMSYMFKFCERLKSIDILDLNSCTNMQETFDGCLELTYANLTNTSLVENFNSTFYKNVKIDNLSVDMLSATTANAMFSTSGYGGLMKNLTLKNVSLALDLKEFMLSLDSANDIITNLLDVKPSNKTLTFSGTLSSFITTDKKAEATAKGWTIAFA